MNRKQRRALQKAGKRKKLPANMNKAVKDVQSAVAKLDKVSDLDETLIELRNLLENTQQTLRGMTSDYQRLAGELDVQREANIRLLTILLGAHAQPPYEWTEQDLEKVRALDATLREDLTDGE